MYQRKEPVKALDAPTTRRARPDNQMERTRVLPKPSPGIQRPHDLRGSAAVYGFKKLTGSHWDDLGLIMDVEQGWLTARASIAGALVAWIDGQSIDEPTAYDPTITVGQQLVACAETASPWLMERLGRIGDPEAVEEPENPAESQSQSEVIAYGMAIKAAQWRDGLLRDLLGVTGNWQHELNDDELKAAWRRWFA